MDLVLAERATLESYENASGYTSKEKDYPTTTKETRKKGAAFVNASDLWWYVPVLIACVAAVFYAVISETHQLPTNSLFYVDRPELLFQGSMSQEMMKVYLGSPWVDNNVKRVLTEVAAAQPGASARAPTTTHPTTA